MTWEEAVAFALSLPETELSMHYGMPAVKASATGRAFLSPGHETATSFVVAINLDAVEMLKHTEPETYWQTPHYEGWPAVLVRYAAADEARLRDVIRRSRDWSAALPKSRPRKRK